MIETIVATWYFFGTALLTGLLVAVMLTLWGCWYVGRNQIFVGLSVAQGSAFGIALGLVVQQFVLRAQVEGKIDSIEICSSGQTGEFWMLQSSFLHFSSVTGALTVLLFVNAVRRFVNAEGLLAWIFLGCASFTTILLAHTPHGLEKVRQLQMSSLIAADRHDLWIFGMLLIFTAAGFYYYRRSLTLLCLDPQTAQAQGLDVDWFELVVAIASGLAIGLSIRTTGILFCFSFLILPVLFARLFTSSLAAMVSVALLFAVVFSSAGFFISTAMDWPPGQSCVAMSALAFPVSISIRFFWHRVRTLRSLRFLSYGASRRLE